MAGRGVRVVWVSRLLAGSAGERDVKVLAKVWSAAPPVVVGYGCMGQ
jgi:hypothetical protein